LTSATKSKLLIVDDDVELLRRLKKHLEKIGYEIETVETGEAAVDLVRTAEVDLVVLDLNFPDDRKSGGRAIDGIEVLHVLRETGKTPILILSSTNVSAVKAMALTLGADDYLSKPFDIDELSARIGAVLRRSDTEAATGKILSFRRLKLDPGERRIWKDGELVDLTGVEFDLIYTLARRPNHVFTREKLLELAWKDHSYSISKVVDVHIGHIRKKLEDDPADPRFILTVRGTGYRFEDSEG
jgi:two-component system, OmpR family, alkaline phosphatase synthesis response regulator PhoP